jgi:hypothetical protein
MQGIAVEVIESRRSREAQSLKNLQVLAYPLKHVLIF